MKIEGCHHIGLCVTDMEKSRDFYTKGLGGEVAWQFPMAASGKVIYLISLGGDTLIELLPKGNGEEEVNARWAHLALKTDDTRSAYNQALAAGAKAHTEPQDKVLGAVPVCNAFVKGPDDELIEFFQLI